MSEETLRSRPAAEGARLLALAYLDEASQASPRLADEADVRALHDFRVGLRRLRSVLKAYKRELRDTVRPKDRDRIAEIAQSTNDGRDAEVQLLWLEKRAPSATPNASAGVLWLINRIRACMEAGYRAARTETVAHFAKADQALRERLSYYDVRVQLGTPPRPEAFGAVTADLLREHVADLIAHRARIPNAADQEAIHTTRIAAKRLRYLLEPLKQETPEVSSLVKRMKDLQDVLGELHDMHVMAATVGEATAEATDAEIDGLLWLTAMARADRDALFARFQGAWSGEALEAFVERVRVVADAIAKRDDVEIERKFLLSKVPPEALEWPFDEIDQGYIPGERLHERVRRVRTPKGEKYFRTIKLGQGVTRTEIEEETSENIFRKLWPLTQGKRVSKRRYRISAGTDVWELDVFKRRKLVLCEIEMEREDAEVKPPEWLAACIVRDVTHEAEFQNVNLAS